MKRILFSIALLASSLAVFAQTPQPDAEYLLYREGFSINEDGSTDFNCRKELLLHAQRAITAYATNGETFIVYNPANEVLTINECYTIRPDGTRVETPKNAFIEQLPEECANCARYNNMREMVIVHTALEQEGIIVLDYTIRRNNVDVLGKVTIAENYPVRRYEFNISAAPKFQYMVQPVNMDRVHYTTSGDKGRFSITCYDVPAMMTDPYLPNEDDLYPTIFLSGVQEDVAMAFFNNNRKDEYITYGEKIQGAETLINELRRESDEATVIAIRDWVLDNVNHVRLPYFLDDYAVDENITWSENCGLNTSRIPLTAALLQKAGFKAQIQWSMYHLPEVDTLHFIIPQGDQHRIIVTINDAQYILNPTSKTSLESPNVPSASTSDIIDFDRSLEWNGKPIANGFAKMELPRDEKALRLNLSLLSSFRTSPLQCQPTSESYHYIITLPEGMKMTSKEVDQEYTFPGVGCVKVKISRKGRTIDVVRRLVVENGLIPADKYQDFRKIISLWETTNEIIAK